MKKALTLILILIICSPFIVAQKTNERPKIGLVLSGGGAKGLAHIGVLKVLEEAGIKPDYITGTSMGSIIGGLYASGYTANQLDSIMNTVDWAAVLSDEIPLTNVVPEEKGDYNRFQLEFDISKKGFHMPEGMVRGQRITELFSELTWHVSNRSDFDDLPIPFRCVAVDLVEGKPYIFKDGSLSQAMRASMAIPSIFTPVEKDSMYLVDGGVFINFPVQICREMGADIIIGVNVGASDKPKIEDLKSIIEILMESSMIGSNLTLEESIENTDYLISPRLHPYTSASFFDGEAIVLIGEEEALKHKDKLTNLADSINAIKAQQHIEQEYTKDKIVISDIVILNREHVSKNYFLSKLDIHEGDTIAINNLNDGIRRLIGTRFYKQITYDFEIRDDNTYQLIFNTEESNLAQAKFSIHYDNELKAGIISNFTFRNILFKNSRLSITGDISESPRVHGEMIAYMGEQQATGFLTDGYFEKTPLPIYKDNLKLAGTLNYYRTQAGAGIFFSYKTKTIISAKIDWEEVRVSQKSGLTEIFDNGISRFGNGFVYGSFIIDRNTLNKRYFASKGHHIKFVSKLNFNAYEYYNGLSSAKEIIEPLINIPEQNYLAASLKYTKCFEVSKTAYFETDVAMAAFSADAPFFDMHYIGGTSYNTSAGDAPFIGLNYREKIAENYGMAAIKFIFNITPSIYGHAVANGIYAPNFGNSHFADEPYFLGPKDHVIGFGGGIAINSIIGPITLGIGTNANDWKSRFYTTIGFPFN